MASSSAEALWEALLGVSLRNFPKELHLGQVKEVGAAQAVCSIQDTATYSHHTLVSTYCTGRRQAWLGSPALHCVPM